jgi:hypothetical protein
MADWTCPVRLLSFAIGGKDDSAHVCFICPNFECSDVDDVTFGHFTGQGAIVFETCFVAAGTRGVKSEQSALRVRCFGVARPTQVV